VAAEETMLTRRGFLTAGGVAIGGLLVAPRLSLARAAAASPPPPQGPPAARKPYVSRPDLNPPPITITTPAEKTAPGYIYLTPFDIGASTATIESVPASQSRVGPLIVDSSGEPVWYLPLSDETAMGLHVQDFRGKPALTWYRGTVLGAYGGNYYVFGDTYHQLATIKAGDGLRGDLHEFLLTPERTALISIYSEIMADLRPVGGPRKGRLVEGVVQEVDIATGRVLFQWRSSKHIGLDESYRTGMTDAGNVDYFHLNSIDIDRDGNLLISARHTSAVYKIDRRTGYVIWRLGGKKNDWYFDRGASFAFQHDVRRHPDGTLTLFDNGATDPGPKVASRGIRIALNQDTRRVRLVQQYRTATRRNGWAMGNVQQLPGGGVFVGWGTDGSFSEFGPDGDLRFDARFGDASVSYRAFRTPWVAKPTGTPSIAVVPGPNSTMTVYASWNGATAVASWEVRTGTAADALQRVASSPRLGFETAITVPAVSGYATAVALDAKGQPLGTAVPAPVFI
jgi:hypothetical protein